MFPERRKIHRRRIRTDRRYEMRDEVSNVKGEKRQLNNDGFSLVELLIAMVILSIIVVPLLHSFVTSARTNAKAGNTMRATAIAEDVMENFEAYSLEELEKRYTAQGFTVQGSDGTGVDADGDGSADPGTAGEWLFSGTLAADSVTSGQYDVIVRLNPSGYHQADLKGINDKQTVNLQNLTGTVNAVYQESPDEALSAYRYFATTVLGKTAAEMQDDDTASVAVQAVVPYVTRTVTVDINSSRISADLGYGTVEVPTYLVTAAVQYLYDDGTNTATYPQHGNNHVIFSNEKDVKEQAAGIRSAWEADPVTAADRQVDSGLANIVFCIRPRYESAVLNKVVDTVIVHNPKNVATNFFLVRQQAEDDSMWDSSYQMAFELQEFWPGWAAGPQNSACTLRSNFLVPDPDHGTDFSYQHHRYTFRNLSTAMMSYEGQGYLNVTGAAKLPAGTGATALTIMSADVLTPDENYDRLYDIAVEIYEAGRSGDGQPISIMTGTVTR